MELSDYFAINEGGRKTLVFHFGAGGGFFSEYNNMLRAICYCMLHNIKFVLYSADAGFCDGEGWQKYFLPFCPETYSSLHSKYNYRFTVFPITNNISLFLKGLILSIIRFNKKYYRAYVPFLQTKELLQIKKREGFDFFTYELWYDIKEMRSDEEVNLSGAYSRNVNDLIVEVDKMIWRYNTITLSAIINTENSLLHHYDYGMQIRRGDKIEEAEIIPIDDFIRILNCREGQCKTAFILTDDYSIILLLRAHLPNIIIDTLCTSEQDGYNFEQFLNQRDSICKKMIALFCSVDFLSNAKKCERFVGTKSANPSWLILMRRNYNNAISLD